MKLHALGVLAVLIAALSCLSAAREIHLPAEAPLSGTVLIAEAFYETVGDEPVALEYLMWPQDWTTRNTSDAYDVHVEAHRGDTIVLSPGSYNADVWVFTPGVTITTDPTADDLAELWGTIEVVADRVTIERIAVVGDRKNNSSGHGIEVRAEAVDVIHVRGCRIEDNAWTGVHVISGTGNQLDELRVEDCIIRRNGMDGVDTYDVLKIVVSGCTISDNGWNFAGGVGVRIFDVVEDVVLEASTITRNRSADVYYDRPGE